MERSRTARNGGNGPSAPRLASAPVTWGVWERTVGRPDLIPPVRMLETVQELGYAGLELGPPGYLGANGAAVATAIAPYGLDLVGGFAPLHFADDELFRLDIPVWLDPIVDVLEATGLRGPVVLADAETEERLAAAGRPEAQRATALPPDVLARAAERVNLAVERCRSRGVEAVFHHHAATYFETPGEIETLLTLTDVGVCFDTGHAVVGGSDPLELARLLGGRIAHVHLKDVDGDLLREVREGRLDLEQAWDDGLFCSFGDGLVDFEAVLALPELTAFSGWTVLEQDRVAVRLADLERVRAIEQANLAFVVDRLAAPTSS
ncbi:MAG: TIM barrel protein [Gaiellaceae bacterium]